MATRDCPSTANSDFSYVDPLLSDMQHLLNQAKLPSYVRKLHTAVIDLRAGNTDQHHYSHGPALINHLMETQAACWKLTQMTMDQSLPWTAVQAQMKAFVALMRAGLSRCNLQSFTHGTLGLLGYNGRFDTQMVLKSHRRSLDFMQLSMPQLAGLAEIGNTLFQHLRALRAQRNSLAEPFIAAMQPSGLAATELGALGAADPLQLSNFAGVVDNLVSIRDAEMQALSTALHRLSLDNWCSDEQYLRLHCRRDDDPCLPSVFLKMVVVVDACNKPSTPRTPSLLWPESQQPERDSQPSGQAAMPTCSQQLYETPAPLVGFEVPGSTDLSEVDVMVDDFLVDSTPTTSTDLDDSFCRGEKGPEVISRQAAAGRHQQEVCPSLQELVAELWQPPQDAQPVVTSSDDSPRPVEQQHPAVPIWGSPTVPQHDTSDGEAAEDLSALPAHRPAHSSPVEMPPLASQPAKLVPLPPMMMSAALAAPAAAAQPPSSAAAVADQQHNRGAGQSQWDMIDPSNMAAFGIIDLLQVGSEQQAAAHLQSCP